MTRDQRTLHAYTFYFLSPILLAALAFALLREHQTHERLTRYADRPAPRESAP